MFYWLFIKNCTHIILSDEELGDDENLIRFDLESDGFELVWDSALSKEEAENYAKTFYRSERFVPVAVPITLKEACDFVNQYHRHHIAPQGHKFSLAFSDGNELIGVAIAGRPVSRYRDDGETLEITRCCVKPHYRNQYLCSKIYSGIRRIAKELGYRRIITYTLEEEAGTSLKASGFQMKGISSGGSWNSRSRSRSDKHPLGRKAIWEATIE